MDLQEKLSEYVELFESVRSKVGDDHLATALLEQIAKDKRVERMRDDALGRRSSGGSFPATERQLAFLEKLGVEVRDPTRLSKAHASELIDEAQERIAAA